MDSSLILSITTFVYAFASVLYIGSWTFKKEFFAKAGMLALAIGFALNTAGIIMRWIESYQIGYGHAPFSNMYESLVFFSWLRLFHSMCKFERHSDYPSPLLKPSVKK